MWSSTPWPHSVLLVLDEWCSGALSRVWHKVKTTQAAGASSCGHTSGSKDGLTGELSAHWRPSTHLLPQRHTRIWPRRRLER
eukprot:4008023-Prymnesium_polylepis.1